MERTIEALERHCHDNINHAIETVEGLGIEYDEDVICDVCRSPDSEEGNDMVFCDKCNICVHQVTNGCLHSCWPESWMWVEGRTVHGCWDCATFVTCVPLSPRPVMALSKSLLGTGCAGLVSWASTPSVCSVQRRAAP